MSDNANEQLLLRPEEASKVLAISPRKLWELTNRKAIPHVRIGKSVRYRPEQLREWLDSLAV
jgi:excisionase family DNA binding protein